MRNEEESESKKLEQTAVVEEYEIVEEEILLENEKGDRSETIRSIAKKLEQSQLGAEQLREIARRVEAEIE